MLQIVFRPGFSRPGHPWVKISKPGHLQSSLVNFVLRPSMKYVAQIPAEEGIKKYNIVTIKAYVWLQGGCFCILQLAEMPCDPQVLPALNWRQARWTGVMWASRWESHVHISRLSVDVVAKVIYSVGQKENKHFTHQLFSCIRIKAFWLVLHCFGIHLGSSAVWLLQRWSQSALAIWAASLLAQGHRVTLLYGEGVKVFENIGNYRKLNENVWICHDPGWYTIWTTWVSTQANLPALHCVMK